MNAEIEEIIRGEVRAVFQPLTSERVLADVARYITSRSLDDARAFAVRLSAVLLDFLGETEPPPAPAEPEPAGDAGDENTGGNE